MTDIGRAADDTMDGQLDPVVATSPRGRVRRMLVPDVEADVNVHVFSVSAGLVGVCLTVIGIIRVGINLKPGYTTIADELLAVDAVFLMGSCLLAYTSLRSPTRSRAKHLEGYADRLFVLGLLTMCAACSLIAFSIV